MSKAQKWEIVSERIQRLAAEIRKSVEFMTSGELHDLGILNQAAWIGERGAHIVVALDAQSAHIAELEAMLSQLEWAGGCDGSGLCPECGAGDYQGHIEGCALATLLHKEATDETES